MKLLLAFILPFLGLTSAAPSSSSSSSSRSPYLPRQAAANTTATAAATTRLTFTGAGASFSVDAPVDGSTFQIPNPISVDHIAQTGTANCAFKGIDGAQLAILGANTGATLAPPQTLNSGSCR